jgi:hypothetical protein
MHVMQHLDETLETAETYACNMKHTLANMRI